jgi:hypothetical protein
MKPLLHIPMLTLALQGCMAIVPNSVRPEFEHMSHLTQHAPFTDHPTRYGANMANLVLHWDAPHHLTVEVVEGIDLDRAWGQTASAGEIIGPREEFSARVGYSFLIH